MYKIVSLFSGIGGFEEGFKSSNMDYEIVLASEINNFAKTSYSCNFDSKNLKGDITKIKTSDIPYHDILCAGFPCQPFSIAGEKTGFKHTSGNLFFEITRILEEKKPKYIFLENVKNLISHDNQNTINIILESLNKIGYSIDLTIINSSEAGLAQNRERTYIFGVLDYKKEKYEKDIRSIKVNKLKSELNAKGFKGFNFFNKLVFDKNKIFIQDILESDVEAKYYYDNENIQEFLNSLKLNRIKKEHKIIKLFDLPKNVYNDLERQRRVYSVNGISPTVLARSDTTKIYIEKENKVRRFTPVENFYVQGFSKEFVKNIKNSNISDTQMYKQAGNAVTPVVISSIINLFLTECND